MRKTTLSFCLLAMAMIVLLIGAAQASVIFSSCNGTIAECEAEEAAEFMMDSETNRRILQQDKRSVGYGALNPDRPVCNPGSGRSYSNCLPQPSNPRHRGCNAYDRCPVGGG